VKVAGTVTPAGFTTTFESCSVPVRTGSLEKSLAIVTTSPAVPLMGTTGGVELAGPPLTE
jgi:hypothetical protein